MIRLLQRRLIIPRGDTGSFTVPLLSQGNTDNIAVFTIFDELTRTRLFQKIIQCEGDVMNVAFTHNDTVNLKPGKYLWDIKFYQNPQFVDEELVNGDEVDSYYAGFSLPVCEIRETADNYLVSPDAPTAMLTPEQLDIITGAISSLNEAIEKTQSNVEHYPIVRNEVWYTWDTETQDYVSTGVRANGIVGPAGTGISSVVLNDDYTLTLNLTDGTSFTSTSIRGEVGNGIDDIVLNNDYTLTIRYTDGEVYTTPSIRGAVGATPQFSIGTVQDGAVAAATITGTAENPVLNLTLPNAHVPTRVSQLENDSGYLTTESDPTVPAWAKAAQKPTYTAAEVGAPTVAEMQQAIANVNTMKIYICAQGEYNAETGVPTVQNPDTQTFYLVPGGEGSNLFIEWVYVNSAWERFGSADVEVPVQDVQVNGTSILNNGVANVPIAGTNNLGVVKYDANGVKGIMADSNGELAIMPATNAEIKEGTERNKPIVPYRLNNAVFYGLAAAAGDTTQAMESGFSGTYTNEAKAAIQTMLDVPSTSDIPEVPVTDVQVNGVSVLDGGVANVPIAIAGDASGAPGVLRVLNTNGLGITTRSWSGKPGFLTTAAPLESQIKGGAMTGPVLSPSHQHAATFYGLAKAAGADMKDIANTTVGVYPDAQKAAIQSMLGISQMLAPTNPNLVASQAYAIGDIFTANGHLYKATAAIAQDEAIIPDTNCVETTMVDAGGKIKDVQVAGSSVVENGIANIPIATGSRLGLVAIHDGDYGLSNTSGYIKIAPANDSMIKIGINSVRAIVPRSQHIATFYGLSKVAGVDLKDETVTLGTYPETSKTAIKEMLGVQDGLKVVRLI